MLGRRLIATKVLKDMYERGDFDEKFPRMASMRQVTLEKQSSFAKGCNRKRKFTSLEDAKVAADQVNDLRPIMFSPLTAYWCERHSCFHCGHTPSSYRVIREEPSRH